MINIYKKLKEFSFINNLNQYHFLNDIFFIKHPICYLTLSGSIAYGTNNENSDIDIRGFYLEDKDEFFTLTQIKEEYINEDTDTVIYVFKKFIKLLINCNPNIIELLGTNKEHILYANDIGNKLRNNYQLFLSKKAYSTFIGYATAQLRRLENALSIINNKDEQMLNSIQSMLLKESNQFNGNFNIYLDDGLKCNINSNNISLKYLISFIKGLETNVNNFDKINNRNKKKDAQHLYKHAMHLIRLYLMGIDILKNQQINTYRYKEHKLLMNIRNGKLSMQEIFNLKNDLQQEIDLAYKYCTLPDIPDYDKINNLMLDIYYSKL